MEVSLGKGLSHPLPSLDFGALPDGAGGQPGAASPFPALLIQGHVSFDSEA